MADNNQRKVTGGENDLRNMLYTEMRRTGGDPSFLFELLETAVQKRAWEYLLDANGEPVGSLRRLIEEPLPTGCGQPAEKMLKMLEIEHRHESKSGEWRKRMKDLKEIVRQELMGDNPALGQHGGDRKSSLESKLDPPVYNPGSVDYKLRRLKRDAPELAQKVIDGEMTANEAAKKAGFEPVRNAVSMDDPESAARTIVKYMSRENAADLAMILLIMTQDEDTEFGTGR